MAGNAMERIVIGLLQPEEILEASALLGRAMCTNPVHVAVLQGQGEKERRCLEAMFRLMLKHAPGRVLLAKDSGRIVGVMRLVEAPRCYPSPVQRLIQMSLMLTTLRGRLPRVLRWLSIWAKHDPKQPHWHLGPLGVLPERQGQGIGSRLLESFCEHLDQLQAAGYLETDRPENVRLYERFGFSVTGEAPVYGARTWFMWRPPPQDAP